MKYFDVHVHLPSPSRDGLDELLRHLDSERDMLGGNLILNTPEEIDLVHRHVSLLPGSLQVIPRFAPDAELPAELNQTGWYKVHPRIGRISAAKVAGVRDALAAMLPAPKGIVVHCFPWGSELEFNTSVPLVVELAQALPGTWILAAHGGGYESWQLRAHAGSFKNVLFDFSVTMAYYQGADALRPFQRYLRYTPSSLLFGTDWPSAESREQLDECVRLAAECDVGAAALERLFLENTRRVWPGVLPELA
jgi:hypothetical protein